MEGMFEPRWKLPFPEDELEVYAMCAHPVAVAYDKLETWLKAENFKPPVSMPDLIDCLYSQVFCNGDGKYEIMRGPKYIPECMPDYIWELSKDLFDIPGGK